MATKVMSKQEILKQIKLEETKIRQAEDRKDSYILKTTSPVVKKKNTATAKSSSNKKKSKSVSSSKPTHPSDWDASFQQPKQKPTPPLLSNTKVQSLPSNQKQKPANLPQLTPKSEFKPESKSAAEPSPATQVQQQSKSVGKLFYAISIISGILLICLVVVIMIGISSGWKFWL